MLELFQYLNSVYPLTPDLQTHLIQVLKRKELRPNTHWLREGEVCNKIAFIEKGLVKIFYDLDDKEIITWFNKERDIMISVKSFFRQIPSRVSIKTIEPVTVNYIYFEELELMYKKFTDFNINARKITEDYYCISEDHLMLMHLPPKQRYYTLIKNYSWMNERIKDKYLANYLGITNVALSKFKKQLGNEFD